MFNMENELYKKYKKYKTKYVELKDLHKLQQKSQSGGLGGSLNIFATKDWGINNNMHENTIGINGSTGTIFNNYQTILPEFLVKDNAFKYISCDFTDTFNANIFIDTGDKYSVSFSKEGGLKTSDKWKYKQIEGSPTVPTSNSTIFFIQTPQGEKKVLKVFSGTDLNKSVTLGTTIEQVGTNLTDYLSLEICKIVEEKSLLKDLNFQNNFLLLNKKEMNDLFNFNDIDFDTELIQTNHNDKQCPLYLSTGNNNPTNDLIINIIFQQLRKENIIKHSNFIKYHNAFIAKYNDNYTYFIIMDAVDDSINKLLPKLDSETEKQVIDYMFDTVKKMCDPIKEKPYLFNHTDMKGENIFYKIFDTKPTDPLLLFYKIKIDDQDKFIAFYVADYDKCSITYHGVRFYNNQAPVSLSNQGFLYNMFLTEKLSAKGATISTNDSYITKEYIIKRPSPIEFIDAVRNIETEQLYIRYFRFPFYTSFDYATLALSMAVMARQTSKKSIVKYSQEYIASTEIDKDPIITYSSIKEWQDGDKKSLSYNGDFGVLLLPAINMKVKFTHMQIKNEIKPKPLIDKIYTSQKENKLCLTIPFYGKVKELGSATNLGLLGALKYLFDTKQVAYILNENDTRTLYSSSNIMIKGENIGTENSNAIDFNIPKLEEKYIIYYTGDPGVVKEYIARTISGTLFVRTNKYSSLKSLYNYDIFDNSNKDHLKKIAIEYFNCELKTWKRIIIKK